MEQYLLLFYWLCITLYSLRIIDCVCMLLTSVLIPPHRQLVEERAELHVNLQEQQRSLDQLQQRLGLAAKENYDLATANAVRCHNDKGVGVTLG